MARILIADKADRGLEATVNTQLAWITAADAEMRLQIHFLGIQMVGRESPVLGESASRPGSHAKDTKLIHSGENIEDTATTSGTMRNATSTSSEASRIANASTVASKSSAVTPGDEIQSLNNVRQLTTMKNGEFNSSMRLRKCRGVVEMCRGDYRVPSRYGSVRLYHVSAVVAQGERSLGECSMTSLC